MRYHNKAEGKYFTLGDTMIRKEANGGLWIVTPTEEQLLEWGYEKVVPPAPVPYIPTYEQRVVDKIRLRYSVDDELAIQWKKETKPQDWQDYYD